MAHNGNAYEAAELPSDLAFEYLAEGGANVVYRVRATQRYAIFPDLNSYLLRVHKDVDGVPLYEMLYQLHGRYILPLFEDEEHTLLSPVLVKIPQHLIVQLNQELRAAEQPDAIISPLTPATTAAMGPARIAPSVQSTFRRDRKRFGAYLDETEEHAFLLKDMSSDLSNGYITIEFKPKWLAQSPNAPDDSSRCRTCALRCLRLVADLGRTGNQRPNSLSLCPLDLISLDRSSIALAVSAVLAQQHPGLQLAIRRYNAQGVLADCLVDYLMDTDGILTGLRDRQTCLDPTGVLENEDIAGDSDFLAATALRDCTLFVKIKLWNQLGVETGLVPRVVEVKLGDLDMKAPDEAKVEKWVGTERRLVEEGWYRGRDEDVVGEYVKCNLARH